jgi:hypothetical protein
LFSGAADDDFLSIAGVADEPMHAVALDPGPLLPAEGQDRPRPALPQAVPEEQQMATATEEQGALTGTSQAAQDGSSEAAGAGAAGVEHAGAHAGESIAEQAWSAEQHWGAQAPAGIPFAAGADVEDSAFQGRASNPFGTATDDDAEFSFFEGLASAGAPPGLIGLTRQRVLVRGRSQVVKC